MMTVREITDYKKVCRDIHDKCLNLPMETMYASMAGEFEAEFMVAAIEKNILLKRIEEDERARSS